jgi:Family of unknown function (DUF6401)
MAEPSAPLSAAALRLAGHVGQTALDRIAEDGVAAAAELDQHMATVRAELAACVQPAPARAQLSRRIANGQGTRHRGGRTGHLLDLGARLAGLRSDSPACPDVPFVSNALQAEETVPVTLLLHYACGFVEAAVASNWWPAESADATDWASRRLAAICQLIVQAEAAAELHPDLRASA